MNNDLISRSKLKKAFNKWWGCDDIPTTIVEDIIDNAPTVGLTELCKGCQYLKDCETCDKTERPQGYWVKDDAWRNGEYIGGFWHRNCPCVDGYSSKCEYNFCPNCGTKMHKGGAV